MLKLFSVRAVTDVLAFIVISSHCTQINSGGREEDGCLCVRVPVYMYMYVCQEVKWVVILECFYVCVEGGLFDRQLVHTD